MDPMTQFGIAELLTTFLTVVITLAFPVGLLFLLYKIYRKVSNIEEQLKKD